MKNRSSLSIEFLSLSLKVLGCNDFIGQLEFVQLYTITTHIISTPQLQCVDCKLPLQSIYQNFFMILFKIDL